MKKITLIFVAFIFVFASCEKDDNTPIENPGEDPTTDALWEVEIDQTGILLTDIVLDDSDNSYFFMRSSDEYILYSYDKDGTQRWTEALSFGSYLNSGIMLADDKLILSNDWDIISAYDMNDGSLLWSTTLAYSYIDMAFSNGTIYVAQSNPTDVVSQVTAIDPGSGTVNWNYLMDDHTEANISVHQNNICVVSMDNLPYPFEFGLTVLSDNGGSATEVWSHFTPNLDDYNPNKPRRASFDGLGNLYYEQSVTDTTYIYSYKVADGQENWKTKLCNYYLPDPVILYGNGKVTATYKSAESWAIVNSMATLDASTGSIIKQNDDVILEAAQVLLTGDYSRVVFNRLLNDLPSMQVYNAGGDLTSSVSATYLDGSALFGDCRITSEGSIVFARGGSIICAKANLSQAPVGSWACRKGTNGNTNSIN